MQCLLSVIIRCNSNNAGLQSSICSLLLQMQSGEKLILYIHNTVAEEERRAMFHEHNSYRVTNTIFVMIVLHRYLWILMM